MFYKGIIFDLDDTLYDYKKCNEMAVESMIMYIINNNERHKNFQSIKLIYNDISDRLKYELNSTASSHNKNIYIKQLLEHLKLDLNLFKYLKDIYWNIFYENILCFDGVKDFIIWNKKIGIKIGILTDYETEYQLEKLEKLGLLQYIDCVVTSEEVGIEKPSVNMFYTILQKMNLVSSDVIMIGDNYEKDIIGSENLQIKSCWFNENNPECNNFIDLHKNFINIYNEIKLLKEISKFCGERFDLVQAGGGNTSVKINNLMFIKASGCNLTTINENNCYVVIDNVKLLEDINNKSTKDIKEYNFIKGENKRASIETFMHSILKKYTIHLHPIQINRILISESVEAKRMIENIYPDGLIIDYLTPGIKVCNKIKQLYNENYDVIFLLNHGIIITCNNIDKLYELINDIINKFEIYQQINFDEYKYTNTISKIVNSVFDVENVSYLCQDVIINNYFNNNKELFMNDITFPDALIYCGIKILFGINNIEKYKNLYSDCPKIIIENAFIYITSHSLVNCKEIEEVLKSNLIILDSKYEKNYLSLEEIYFLNNWDAEKYRKYKNT